MRLELLIEAAIWRYWLLEESKKKPVYFICLRMFGVVWCSIHWLDKFLSSLFPNPTPPRLVNSPDPAESYQLDFSHFKCYFHSPCCKIQLSIYIRIHMVKRLNEWYKFSILRRNYRWWSSVHDLPHYVLFTKKMPLNRCTFSSFSLIESPPSDLQITANK